MIRVLFYCLSSVLAVALISPVEAQETNSSYGITLGLSIKQVDFDFYRHVDDLEPTGIMTNGMYFTYMLRLGTPYKTFGKGKIGLGYYFASGISNFSMNKQEVNLVEKNLHTQVDGFYAYFTPTGFVWFGAAPNQREKRFGLLIGTGLGLGYLRSHGNMILTEDHSQENLNVNIDDTGMAVTILMELYWGPWVASIYGGGPYAGQGDSEFSVFEFSTDFGYRFEF